MTKFPWGHVIERFAYDFDGSTLVVIKYHPKTGPDAILYHCEELHASYHTFDAVLVGWIAQKRLGLNQYALVSGICRALEINE